MPPTTRASSPGRPPAQTARQPHARPSTAARTAATRTPTRPASARASTGRVPPRVPKPAQRPTALRPLAPLTAVPRSTDPRRVDPRRVDPRLAARARARARAAAREARTARRAETRRRLLTGLVCWARRAGAVGTALVVVLLTAVVLSGTGLQPPAAASAPLDLTARATALRDALTGTTTELLAASAATDAAEDALATAQAAQQQADAALAAARAEVGVSAADLYRDTTTGRVTAAGLPGSGDPAVATDLAVLAAGTDQQLATRTTRAALAARAAQVAADRVSTATAVLAAAHQRTTELATTARDRATGTDVAVTAALAGLTAAPTSPDQQAADDAARQAWQARLAALASAGITLPSTAQLASGDLPPGLAPVRDALGTVLPGVASGVVAGQVVSVPSAETATATSYALAQLGTPYVPGGTGAAGTDCMGLTAGVWSAAGHPLGPTLVAQWAAGTVLPADQWQPGDLVFGSDPAAGLDDVGIYVGDGQVVTASAVTHQVAVRSAPPGATAVRVTVPPATPNVAPASDGSVSTLCGAPPVTTVAAPVDPAWGGWSNGQIPASSLCSIGGGQLLRCDAATGYDALAEAYANAFGTPLCITDSYRSLAAQVDAHERKPRITATPGTSNHGWGLAVDLCGGVNGFGTAQHAWMDRWAGRFGWVHPDWAQAGGENPEPWHWEFGVLAD